MKTIRATAAGLLLLIAVLLQVIDSCCFDRSFYVSEYGKNKTAEVIGMSEDALMETTDVLLDYLKDRRQDILVTQTVRGKDREIFDLRETMHMEDVKKLYQNAMTVKWAAMIVSVVLFGWTILQNRDRAFETLRDGLKNGGILLALFTAFIMIWAIADFNGFWISFHYLLFDNELFFLNPNTEILINMVPESFFFDLVTRIILVFFGLITVGTVGMVIWGKRRKKNA